MIRFSKIFFYITVAVLLVWQLPWCYAFLTLKPVKTPFTMYSSVLGDFVITQLDENKQLHRYDTKGNTYTQQQVDSLLPSLYVRRTRRTNVSLIPFVVRQLVRKIFN